MGHWYDSVGNPRHFEGKDGKGTTLREARKLCLYPSVTTIGNIKSKFQLTNWLQEQAALMAVAMMDGRTVFDVDWAKEVVRASREATMAKADEGTDIHDILERFQANPASIVNEGEFQMCEQVAFCVEAETGMDFFDSFKTETRFCDTTHGYAGMCDLHNDTWFIDYKSKDTVDDKTRGWKEQAEQLAAYANGIGYPAARLANVFISRTPPADGEPWGVRWFEHKDDMAWERFRHALMMWQVENKFGPYFDSLSAKIAA